MERIRGLRSLRGAWGQGNELIFCSASNDRSGNASLRSRAWLSYSDGPLQTLLVAWHGIFTHTQRRAKQASRPEDLADYLYGMSRKYRAEMVSMIDKTERAADRRNALDQAEIKRIKFAYIALHLCEVIILSPNPNATQQMVAWLHASGNYTRTEADSDWDWLFKLVLHGRSTEAVRMVRQLFPRDQNLAELVAAVPALSGSRETLQTLAERLREYKSAVERHMQVYDANTRVLNLLRILRGDYDTIARKSTNWYELMVAILIYKNPEITKENYQYLAEECMGVFEDTAMEDAKGSAGPDAKMVAVDAKEDPKMTDPEANFSQLDQLLLAIFRRESAKIIQVCMQLIDKPWFLAHLVDLLYHAGALDLDVKLENGENLREFALLEYGTSLMSHPALWEISVGFFAECGVRGREHIRRLVEMQPLDSHSAAYRLLAICDAQNMPVLRRTICNRMGVRAARRQRDGEAINWFVRAREVSIVERLSQRLLLRLLGASNESGSDAARANDGDAFADIEGISLDPLEMSKRRKNDPVWASLTLLDRMRRFCQYRQAIMAIESAAPPRGRDSKSSRPGISAAAAAAAAGTEAQRAKNLRELQGKAARIILDVVGGGIADTTLWLQILHQGADAVSAGVLAPFETLRLIGCLEGVCSSDKTVKDSKGSVTLDLEKNIERMRARLCAGMSASVVASSSTSAAAPSSMFL